MQKKRKTFRGISKSNTTSENNAPISKICPLDQFYAVDAAYKEKE